METGRRAEAEALLSDAIVEDARIHTGGSDSQDPAEMQENLATETDPPAAQAGPAL